MTDTEKLDQLTQVLGEHRSALVGLSTAMMELIGKVCDLETAVEMMAAELNPDDQLEAVEAEVVPSVGE